MNVGIHTRVSTTGQVDGESLPEQERNARASAETTATTWSRSRPTRAAPGTERRGLADALEALGTGALDALVMRDLDRLAVRSWSRR